MYVLRKVSQLIHTIIMNAKVCVCLSSSAFLPYGSLYCGFVVYNNSANINSVEKKTGFLPAFHDPSN